MNKNKRILIVAAHPDDEILGCGGTTARLVKEGYEVFTAILGEGVTSRDPRRERRKRERDIRELKRHMREANAAIGVKEVFAFDFPDNRFDSAELLDIIKVIERIKDKVKPGAVYTHHHSDLNIDHKRTYDAVLAAFRPMKEERAKEIYSFEIPSATEWNYPYRFNPNTFVDISKTIDAKIRALKSYATEIKDFPHPRSEESIKAIARRWGSASGLSYAEAFELVRCIR